MPEHHRIHTAATMRRTLSLLFVGVAAVAGFVAGMTVHSLTSSASSAQNASTDTTSSVSTVSSAQAAASPEEEDAQNMDASTVDSFSSAAGRSTEQMSFTPILQTTDDLIERRVEKQLKRLSAYFTDGAYWNHCDIDISAMSDTEAAMCVTDTPCTHSINGYDYCNVYNGAMAQAFPQYDYETQCLGYASLISDLLFGTNAPVTEFYDFDALRIGDHIRLVYNEHSMIVTDIDWDTDTITVTEVNADYENCKISWGRTFTRDELYSMESDVRFYTRYDT